MFEWCVRRCVENELYARSQETSVRTENIEATNKIVRDNRHITVQEIARQVSINICSVYNIVKNNLGYHNIEFRWVRRTLAENHGRAA